VSNSLQWPKTQFPPYSRAAATAYLANEKIPSTNRLPEREIRDYCGGLGRYGLNVLPRQLHRGAKLHRVTKSSYEILVAK
jgi:hypothetical protein